MDVFITPCFYGVMFMFLSYICKVSSEFKIFDMKKHSLLLFFVFLFSCFCSFAHTFDDFLRNAVGRPKGNVKLITSTTEDKDVINKYYSSDGRLDSVVSNNAHYAISYGETKVLKYKLLRPGVWWEISLNKDSCVCVQYNPDGSFESGEIEYLNDKGWTIKKRGLKGRYVAEYRNTYDPLTRTLRRETDKEISDEIEEFKYNVNGDIIEVKVRYGKPDNLKLKSYYKYNDDGELVEFENFEKIVKYTYSKFDAKGNWTECVRIENGKRLSDQTIKEKRSFNEPIRGDHGVYTEKTIITRKIVYY